jgi:hypothetical protein
MATDIEIMRAIGRLQRAILHNPDVRLVCA